MGNFIGMNSFLVANSGGKTGDGLVVAAKKPSGKLDELADIRDSISSLVGGGYKTLSDDASKGAFTRLAGIVGLKKATDLFVHITQQNQREGWDKKTPAQRVGEFYNIPSTNPNVQEQLQKVKSFGSGPVAGYYDSISQAAQTQQGNGIVQQPLLVAKK